MKTRPRKTQPTVYAPLPPLPPDWTLVSDTGAEAAVPSLSDLQAPLGSE
ncbi:hypothetical protein Pint_08577 [Pistacia integerrima]|uniref:Uncharacterized protein n=1 Tax=Pistacia integerrima TaxID=434235 RepID=A0ACC0XU54_9ROSI|nr:hypothetical protein Pint_08577 [Pistacia integerrima]